MRAKPVPSDPAAIVRQWVNAIKNQPRLAQASYLCGLLGSLLAVHDYHHYNPNQFGLSTILLGAAILLYLFSLRSKVKRPPPPGRR